MSIRTCVELGTDNTIKRPAYCDQSTYKVPESTCKPYKKALNALWASKNSNPVFSLPIASCKNVDNSLVAEASNNGLDVLKMAQNWATQNKGYATEMLCAESAYGVFHPTTGEKLTRIDPATGSVVPVTADTLYEDYFAGCDPTDGVGPYIYRDGSSTCPSATFAPKCQDPNQVRYGQCKNPGWDYLDRTSSSTWRYGSQNACLERQFTGAEYTASQSGSNPINCSSQCCVYASGSTDNQSSDCASCGAQGSDPSNKYYRNWSGSAGSAVPSVTLTGWKDQTTVLPYCNAVGRTSGQNHQGVAVSLSDVSTNQHATEFGDPAECRGTGKFAGKCHGLTGCDGLGGRNALILSNAPCRMGFSSTNPSNPATNCPNIYTLQNSGESANCRFSTTGDQQCVPGSTCDVDAADISRMNLTTSDGFPRVKKLEIPEGAWVTAYDNSSTGATTAPNNAMTSLCDPNTFPKSGANAWTFGCGRDSDGHLVGQSTAINVGPDGQWRGSTAHNQYDGTCSSDGTGCETGNSVNTETRTCTFQTDTNAPLYGWSFGFMPGYYNSTCTTNNARIAPGNECGSLVPK